MDNLVPQKSSLRRHLLFYLSVLAVILSFGLGLATGSDAQRKLYLKGNEPATEQIAGADTTILKEIWEKLRDKYVGDIPSSEKMVYGMAKGMTAALDDPYTVFFDPEKAKQFKEDLKGSFDGIGAEIGVKHDILTVVSPIKDSPAEKAGLKPGDKIVKIDDSETSGLEIDEAVRRIRGEKGTKVKLLILPENESTPKEVEITRDVINVKSVDFQMKEDGIAYIQMSGFNEDTLQEFAEVGKKVTESGAKKIILDLRNNPGGYLNTAVDVAGFFLPENSLVVKEEFGGKKPANEYRTKYPPTLDKYPLVILINEGSASASEILAGALSEIKGAKLVGEKTFGKGSVQEFIPLSDNSTVKITVALWYTPNGKSINKEGIKPDEEVEITEEDAKNKKDTQLEKAIEIAKSL